MRSDLARSIVRTLVPAGWALVAAFLVKLGLPDVSGWSDQVVDVASLAVFYAGARWLQPVLPSWLVTVLFGSNAVPLYAGNPKASAPGDEDQLAEPLEMLKDDEVDT